MQYLFIYLFIYLLMYLFPNITAFADFWLKGGEVSKM